MKHKYFSLLRTVLGLAMIALVVTVAHAWTAPTSTAPAGNVPVPVNTGATYQTKSGDFSSLGSISASKYVAALQFLFAPMAVLGCTNGLSCLLNATNTLNQDVLRAGSFNTSGYLTQGLRVGKNGNTLIGAIDPATGDGPGVVVQSTGDFTVGKRLSWFVQGLTVASTTGKTTITGPLAITSGTPGVGKVLGSSSNVGDTSWVDLPPVVAADAQPRIGLVLRSGSSSGEGDHEISRECPSTLPILISASAECSYGGDANPAALAVNRMDYMGGPGSPGKASFRCVQNNMNTNSPSVASVRLVCASPEIATVINYGTTVQESWHDVALGEGSWGQSCQAWLDNAGTLIPYSGQPAQSISSFPVGVLAVSGAVSLAAPVDNPGCVYQKNTTIVQADSVLGHTYIGNGGQVTDIWGNNFARQPKTFSDPNWKPIGAIGAPITYSGTTSNGSSSSGTLKVYKTMIKY